MSTQPLPLPGSRSLMSMAGDEHDCLPFVWEELFGDKVKARWMRQGFFSTPLGTEADPWQTDELYHIAVKLQPVKLKATTLRCEIGGFENLIESFLTKYELCAPDCPQTDETPSQFIDGVRDALTKAQHFKAREIALSGSKKFPRDPELAKLKELLGKPQIIRSDLPSRPSAKANALWLQKHSSEYAGLWVALRDGQIVGSAPRLRSLRKKVGGKKTIVFVKIP